MAQKKIRGFAAMSPEQQREIASKGGRAAHLRGTAHEWDSSEAAAAGRKGGRAAHHRNGSLSQTATARGSQTISQSTTEGGRDRGFMSEGVNRQTDDKAMENRNSGNPDSNSDTLAFDVAEAGQIYHLNQTGGASAHDANDESAADKSMRSRPPRASIYTK